MGAGLALLLLVGIAIQHRYPGQFPFKELSVFIVGYSVGDYLDMSFWQAWLLIAALYAGYFSVAN